MSTTKYTPERCLAMPEEKRPPGAEKYLSGAKGSGLAHKVLATRINRINQDKQG